jgi:hypothetical protein
MSHDIRAKRPNVDTEAICQAFCLGQDRGTDEWSQRYGAYLNATCIAWLGRTGGDPMNQVIYMSLGVMDEAYAGCSGAGVKLKFDVDQLREARDIVQRKDFSKLTREVNEIDHLTALLSQGGVKVEPIEWSSEVDRELDFLKSCIDYLEEAELEEVEIVFG